MTELDLTLIIAGVIAGATPIVLAAVGETITEKSGLINLSLDGSILLSAMAAFVVARQDGQSAGGLCRRRSGRSGSGRPRCRLQHRSAPKPGGGRFVLTLMTRDLAYFLGNPYARLPGPNGPGSASRYWTRSRFWERRSSITRCRFISACC